MSPSNSSDSYCRICNSKLDPSINGGGCPACLWSLLISGEDNPNESDDTPEIEGYDVLEQIGSGGMGIVYRARQHLPDREVAIKIVAPFTLRASQARQRFMLEVEAMAAVEHPALLPLYDTGEDESGRPWLSMQLAHGGTLGERIETFSKDWRRIAELMITLIDGIQYAHERGILHRDLKPANILFDDKDNPYIADFGLAKWADGSSSITQSTYLLGSPAYLAPEAAEGGSKCTTTVSDVYGLGAVLYELLCGKQPYQGNSAAEVITQIIDHPPMSPKARISSIPRDLEIIVMKAMAHEPERRYHSAAAFSDDLHRWLDGKMILARPVSKMERLLIWAKRNPALSTLSVLLIASLLTGGILLWKSNQELTIALDDAEDRVEFMTRELPPRLEPLGRLDLLDDVFENVSEHYDMESRTDPDSLARHADFLTQWAQILRPRGQVKESLIRLEAAVAKAEEATSEGSYSVEAARSRISSGRRLGEALIESKDYEKARSILSETITVSDAMAKEYKNNIRLTTLIAELYQEKAILELKEEKYDAALKAALKAQALWDEVVPEMKLNPDSPHYQQALLVVSQSHYFLHRIYQAMGKNKLTAESLENHLKFATELVQLSPGHLNFLHEVLIARRSIVINQLEQKSIDYSKAILKLIEIDTELQHLTSNAPTNIRWRTDYASIALEISHVAKMMNDKAIQTLWMEKVGERSDPLYKIYLTDLSFLYAHRDFATHYGRFFADTKWEKAKPHLLAAAKIQIQICTLDSSVFTQRSLIKGTRNIVTHIEAKDGKQAAKEWLNQQVGIYRKEGLWQWASASCYKQIASYSEPSDETQTMHRKQLELLINVTNLTETIPELNGNLYHITQTLLDSIRSTESEEISTLTKSISALGNIRKNTEPNPEADQKWLELTIKHVAKFPSDKRHSIIDLTLKEFFPEGKSNDPLYQQLQQLKP